jgi:hypothetical protein
MDEGETEDENEDILMNITHISQKIESVKWQRYTINIKSSM